MDRQIDRQTHRIKTLKNILNRLKWNPKTVQATQKVKKRETEKQEPEEQTESK